MSSVIVFKRIKRKMRSCLMKPFNELKAKHVYEAIKKHKKDNEICILLNGLIGDSVYGLAYLDAIKGKNPDKRIIVYGHKKYARLIESYNGIDEIRYVDGEDINQSEKDTYSIYTNVIGEQKPINGTQELRCSIYELFEVVKKSSLVISTRSGILDYLVPTDIDMFVIYENCSEKLKNMYHLSSWNRYGRIKELYATNIVEDTPKIIDELKMFLNI